MLLMFYFGTLLMVIVTVLPLYRHPHWIVRGWDFPRLQIAILAASLLVADILFLDLQTSHAWLLIFATVLCLFWQLWWILPYTVFWSKEVKTSIDDDPKKQLSIMTSNVLKTNRNSDALIALVTKYQPDILVTLESDSWWEKQLAVLEIDMPHSVKCPLDNLYGMHVYSKLPFCKAETAYLVEKDIPSIHVSLQLRTGDQVGMHFVHPAPPSPTENTESTERDTELIAIARSITETTEPVVVTGDLNDVAWSATTRLFRKISGLLDPRVGRGMFNTFHVDYFFMRWPLDHLFHSSHFTLKSIRRLPSIGSDHFALFTKLVFTPKRAADQEGLQRTQADNERAELVSDDSLIKKAVPSLDE